MAQGSQAGANAIRLMMGNGQNRRALHKLAGLELNPVLPRNFVSLLKALEDAEERVRDNEPDSWRH